RGARRTRAMTCEVIDSTHHGAVSCGDLRPRGTAMTAVTVSPATTEDRLRSVLLADGVVTAGVGLVGLLGPSWYAGPGWLARAVGAVFLVVGVEVAVLSRGAARRLRLTGLVVAESAFAWTVTALLATALADMDAAGREVLVLTALGTLAFGV